MLPPRLFRLVRVLLLLVFSGAFSLLSAQELITLRIHHLLPDVINADQPLTVSADIIDSQQVATAIIKREVNNPALGATFYSALPGSPLEIERIEIIRGPGGSLVSGIFSPANPNTNAKAYPTESPARPLMTSEGSGCGD